MPFLCSSPDNLFVLFLLSFRCVAYDGHKMLTFTLGTGYESFIHYSLNPQESLQGQLLINGDARDQVIERSTTQSLPARNAEFSVLQESNQNLKAISNVLHFKNGSPSKICSEKCPLWDSFSLREFLSYIKLAVSERQTS